MKEPRPSDSCQTAADQIEGSQAVGYYPHLIVHDGSQSNAAEHSSPYLPRGFFPLPHGTTVSKYGLVLNSATGNVWHNLRCGVTLMRCTTTRSKMDTHLYKCTVGNVLDNTRRGTLYTPNEVIGERIRHSYNK